MAVNINKSQINLREQLKKLERPTTDKLVVKGNDGVVLGPLTGDLNLQSIDSYVGGTAVDVFVYDTRKDSDGGAWRHRCQHTSWYNETLNTATRGSRREFPAVAVLVLTSTSLTIYDGDDPDLPMWMVFTLAANYLIRAPQASSFYILNAKLVVGDNANYSGSTIDFIMDGKDAVRDLRQVGWGGNIADRNTDKQTTFGSSLLVGTYVKDVAMTVLPNAPIDSTTGLPIPTIAVATNAGVSVIKDDGTVVDLTCSQGNYNQVFTVAFNENNDLIYDGFNNNAAAGSDGKAIRINEIPSSDTVVATLASAIGNSKRIFHYGDWYTQNSGLSIGEIVASGGKFIAPTNDATDINFGESIGVSKVKLGETDSRFDGSVCLIKSSYNTGWMHGDIKGAFLSDTDATNVTGSELITNGTFDTDTTGWTPANGATLTQQSNGNPGGNINVASGTTSNGYASQSNTVVVGKYYTLTFDHYHVNGSEGYVNIGTTTGASQYVYQPLGTSSSWTRYSFTIKATSTNLFTGFYSRPNGNVRYDNISLREADPDRSVNDNGLQVFGTITKSAVATGAELVAYSGFEHSNPDNYLYQPYNSGLNFGTGDFSISFWIKPIILDGYVLDRSNPSTSENRFAVYCGTGGGGSIYFYTVESGVGASEVVATNLNSYLNTWMHIVCTRDSSRQKIFVNGKVAVDDAKTARPLNATTAGLYIGIRHSLEQGEFDEGSLALLRISGSIPSAEQIKKIYEDEKILFQENAACTLYGSSDAVTALAYDDTTSLLHVGTSSGRSEFKGLRRVGNTTTAVTTVISASNGLVAEQ